jgi:iron complex outermembrane receptor protein
MVNGVRINDSQTGHHNADFPVLLEDVDRIEILYGPGSSLYGADALGGTINIVTKKKQKGISAEVEGGQYGLWRASVKAGVQKGRINYSLGATFDRSSGFAFDREFRTLGFTAHTQWGERLTFLFSHLEKEFGANGFYGASPSKERTDVTFLNVDHQWIVKPAWELANQIFYRTHGDHFLWDVRLPGFFENFHRTHTAGTQLRLRHTASEKTKWSVGIDAGGDWIGSNRLGNHSLSRTGVMGELQRKLGSKAVVALGARFDAYSKFGNSFDPSFSGSWWFFPTVKLRSSVGHAFRIPTFTELYYIDPGNQATSTLKPEEAWGAEVGTDWIFHPNWMTTLTFFARDEKDVIDWIRETPLQKWRTANLRQVGTRGLEVGIQHLLPRGRIELQYTYLDVRAGAVPFLSKYVLDYARHSVIGFASLTLPVAINLGPRLSYRFREDGRDYWILDCRVARQFGRFKLYLEGSNLTNSQYQEIRGVDMPGLWLRTGLEVAGL